MTHALNDGKVVADEEIAEAEFGLQFHHQVDHLGLDRHVEGGHRFVGDHQLGTSRERSSDADPLTLTTGELMRKLAHHVGLEPNPSEEVGHLLVSVRALGNLVDEERFRNGASDRPTRVETRKRILENDLHLGPVLAKGAVAEARNIDAIQHDLTTGRVMKANHRVSKRRLAAARLANNGKGLSPPDLQRDVFHCVHGGTSTDRKVLTEVTDLDQGRASAHESYSTSSNGAGSERPCIDPSRGTDASSAWV